MNITFHPDAVRQLYRLPRNVQQAVLASIARQLEPGQQQPAQRIAGVDRTFRFNLGRYRVTYKVGGSSDLTVLIVSDRKDTLASATHQHLRLATGQHQRTLSVLRSRISPTDRSTALTAASLPRKVRRLLISTLKGGPGKTTSALLLAMALAKRGFKVAVICADTRTRGATDWCFEAERRGYELPFNLFIWEDSDGPLSGYAKKVEAQSGADFVIIDTGGEQPDHFTHGCLYADLLIAPVGPMQAELRRILQTFQTASEVSAAGAHIDVAVLLTRCPTPGKGKAKEARDDLSSNLIDEEGNPNQDKPYALGLEVLETEISRNVAYDDIYGTVPEDTGDYEALADELLERFASALTESGVA